MPPKPAPKVDVFMPWFVGDYLRDTPHLMAEEHGAYLMILGALWNMNGSLPADEDRLCSIAKVPPSRWAKVWVVIKPFFALHDGQLAQKRLTSELGRARDLQSKASERGRQLAAKRWGGPDDECVPHSDTQSDTQCEGSGSGEDTAVGATPADGGLGANDQRDDSENQDGRCVPHSRTECSPPPPPHSQQPQEREARSRIFDLDPKLDHDPLQVRPTPPPATGASTATYEALLEVGDAWCDLRGLDVPKDPTVQDGARDITRRRIADGLFEASKRFEPELMLGALRMGWLDLGDAKRWPGWRSKMATPDGVVRTLANSQLVEQFRTYRAAKAQERKDSHVPPPVPDRVPPTVADLEEFRRARELVRDKIRKITGSSS